MLLFVNLPISVPASLKEISPPSASRIISPATSSVKSPASDIVEPSIVISSTVRAVRVPTEVKLDAVTPDANVLPDNVPAAAVTVMAADQSKLTPLIALGVVNVAAEPVVF